MFVGCRKVEQRKARKETQNRSKPREQLKGPWPLVQEGQGILEIPRNQSPEHMGWLAWIPFSARFAHKITSIFIREESSKIQKYCGDM